jgi:uncharacterized membrane protein
LVSDIQPMDMSSLADPAARSTFESNFKQDMASSAGVTADMVIINSVTAGSVVVSSTVYFPPTATVTPAAFTVVLSTNPAAMFTPSFLILTGGAVEASDLTTGVAYVTLSPPPPSETPLDTDPPVVTSANLAARPAATGWALLAAAATVAMMLA